MLVVASEATVAKYPPSVVEAMAFALREGGWCQSAPSEGVWVSAPSEDGWGFVETAPSEDVGGLAESGLRVLVEVWRRDQEVLLFVQWHCWSHLHRLDMEG